MYLLNDRSVRWDLVRGAFAVLALLFAAGCEYYTDPNDLPFEEKLVIRGVLDAGRRIDTIQVQKTLPFTTVLPNDLLPGDSLPSYISNANVVLSWQGRTQKLRYSGNGNYTSDSIIAEPGVTYTLTTDWNGHHAVASTTVPQYPYIDSVIPHVDTARFSDQNGRNTVEYGLGVMLYIRPGAGAPYGIYGTFSSPGYTSTSVLTYCDLDTSKNIANEDTVVKNLGLFSAQPPNGDSLLKFVTIGLITYDRPYYNYYQTRPSRSYTDGSGTDLGGQTSSSNQTLWNVTGDGIGLFIGRALTLKHR